MKNTISTIALSLFVFISLAQSTWTRMADYPGNGRHAVASFAINNKGYMGLGKDSVDIHQKDWYEYNPGNNTWTQKASLPGLARGYCITFVIGSKGYVVTGQHDNGALNELWEYDAVNDTWTAKANFPGSPRMNGVGFSIGNKGYAGTGYIGVSTVVKDFYEYDPSTNTWTQKADFPGAARNSAAGFSTSNKGYIGMGASLNGYSYYNDLYKYDPASNSWVQKANFPLPMVNNPVTYSSTNSGYILCGYFIQYSGIMHNPMNMFYKYDEPSDEWTLLGTFPGYPRGYAGGFALNNDIYIGAGGQGNGPLTGADLNDLWKLNDGLSLMINSPENTEFQISPNPVEDLISFEGDIANQITDIHLYDVSGKLLSTIQLKNGVTDINVSALATGTYFIEAITADGRIMNSRFIKQ